jgi:hypothetical protein
MVVSSGQIAPTNELNHSLYFIAAGQRQAFRRRLRALSLGTSMDLRSGTGDQYVVRDPGPPRRDSPCP